MTPEIKLAPNGVGTVNFGTADQINVVFHSKLVTDQEATRAAGRTIKKNVDYVFIQIPGDRDYTDAPVSDKPHTVNMYPRQWAAFQQKKEYVAEGTPLENLFAQDDEQPIAANLRSAGIHTVEQLANLSASAMDGVGMGAQAYVNHAKKYLEVSEKGVAYHKLQKELKERDNKIEVLENNLKLMNAQVERLSAQIQGSAQQTFLSVQAQAPMAQQAYQHLAPIAAPQPVVLPPPPWEMRTPDLITGSDVDDNHHITPPPIPAPPWAATEQPTAPKKARGWPKGKPRGPRNQTTPA